MNRALVSATTIKGHPAGTKIGTASEITGYGAEVTDVDVVSVRVRLDAHVQETFYFPEAVVDEMKAKFTAIRRKRKAARK